MTPEEKIRLLITYPNKDTTVLAIFHKEEKKTDRITIGDVVDIINRQQAEIEDLQLEIEGLLATKKALINGQLTLQKHLIQKDSYINQLQNENEILHKNADEAYQQGLDENRALFEKNILSEFWNKVKAKADADKIIAIDCRWAVSQNMGDEILKEMDRDLNV